MKIPFHRAYLSTEEINSVTEVIKSGWLTMGEKTFEFEKSFSDYVGASHSIAVNSCTAALHLALKSLNIGPGDEVILPAMTFVATWEVITYLKAKPVLCDVNKDTFLIEAKEIEKKITKNTKAIICVHYGGLPCDMDSILDLASKNNIHVIEDAAHALPATYKTKKIGTISKITCFSFYATKTITTGEGGMITTEDSEISERIKRLRLHGITKDAWNRYSEKGTWVYDVSEPGYKYNMTDIAAAIGIEQLKKCDLMNSMRQKIAQKYTSAFAGNPLLELWKVDNPAGCSWHLYPIKLNIKNLKIDRDEFIEKLKFAGIGTSVHYIPIYRFTIYKDSDLWPEFFHGCEDIFSREVSLPIYPGMSEEETQFVIDTVMDILNKNKK
ncbi:MAG TPA: DegT/DnrJ/EryC1/StrS family aminotransferase [Spirochaetota bacterium]|jgi:perosamine synthetase|nr:MAG: UDP-4-amino-4-deoxy-L-arabinose--oxoglutarate aminotransferase [Spirochaetes bacterium ADurb.Bin218]HON17322.1 DegT/DnrJ/EryC1/StrS family aminotransferase [Spirochaetota bacterium]HPX90193.1 DegT/DnrJ/EryC1/StrS family aminotransferase [Spirochaetota bacterium]